MSSGELRFLVSIQSQSDSPPVPGDYSDAEWDEFCTAWASIQFSAGKEVGTERDSTLGQAKIKIRYRSDITNEMSVLYDGVRYEIEDNFDMNGRRKYLIILAKVFNK